MGNKASLGPCQPLGCDRRLAVTTVENTKSETNYCYPSTFREMKRRLLGLETPFVISVARKVMDLSFWENYIGIRVRTAIISRCAILLSIAFEFADVEVRLSVSLNIRRIQKTEPERASLLALVLCTQHHGICFSRYPVLEDGWSKQNLHTYRHFTIPPYKRAVQRENNYTI
jgi:hypothetical protein